MPTKEQVSEAINSYLETDIDWSKLNKEDLDKVVTLLDDPVELIRKIARTEAEGKIKDRGKDVIDKVEEALKQVPRPFGILDFLMEKREK